jgi:outer membrane protein assembly factor BamB
VYGDRVYVAAIHSAGLSSYGAVYCLDRPSGAVLWKFDDDGDMQQVFSTPCLADGRLYIGEGLHENRGCKFYCLDGNTGQKLWHFETTSHTESSPCAAGGRVFFGAGDDGIYCFDASGRMQWHFQEPLHVDANPIVVGTRLYAGSGVSSTHKATEIVCLATADGKVLWHAPTDLPVWGSPAVDGDGHVFFGLGNGRMDRSAEPPAKPAGAVLCLHAETGRQRWRYDVSDAVLVKPAVDEQHVFFGSRDCRCYCIDRKNGSLCWQEDLGSPLVAAPALIENRLYVAASGGRVCCLDADSGKITWSFDVAAYSQTRPQLLSSPAVVLHRAENRDCRRIYFGAGLQGSLSSAAALYCLQD